MIQQKVELRFEKGDAVRFISHHDLMRAMMRAVRRAALPVRLTEGFNPRLRIVFPVALEVGVVSLDEVAEIELTQWLDTQTIYTRLSSTFPPGLVLKTVKALPLRRAGQTPRRIQYRLHLKEAGLMVSLDRCQALLQAASLPFQRSRKNRIQDIDIRPALLDITLETTGDLLIEVAPNQKGSARPLEVLSLVLNESLDSLKHVRSTKLWMELEPPLELLEAAQ
ncbi:MAG: TIGR03936 family radical SAM-associated protein [Planctomycetota bacterium]